jgi:signal transduction histidine kinase
MDLAMAGNKAPVIPEFLAGGGEMGLRIREFDWSGTSLGPVELWPQSLRTCIRIMLDSRQPIWIGWGKDLINLYNDPYKAIVGGKHPWALGKPAEVVWREIWPTIEPMLQQVMEKDEGTYVESQYLIMERNGYPEETYYTFSYTPIPGDNGGTAGMICFNTDDTERIISERQLSTLTRLGKNLTNSQSTAEVIHKTIDTLLENPDDFPVACFYRIAGDTAFLADCTHYRPGLPRHANEATRFNMPTEIDLSGSNDILPLVKKALVAKQPVVLEDASAIILPLSQSGISEPYGFLLTGLNPYRQPDEKYRGFFSLLADQVTTSFGTVHILDAERKQVRALAEVDKAKTIFFSNISHEFRTPLTLLLGPIEDAMNNPEDIPNNRLRMSVAHRNALRMQKLVNTLLEFSRIEAGRMDGQFTAVDIVAFTADLASSFRSAIEKAGMQLRLDLEPVTDEVYVDPVIWEKIILNLVSNAFKYTIRGSITVCVRQDEGEVRISVTDTGIGIPDDQLERIFDRFHRVENVAVRSQEGTGIGLSLVKELVRIHHGHIEVTSRREEGSTFTVVLPTGKAHLPPDRITAGDAITKTGERDLYVEESLQWLPDPGAGLTESDSPAPPDKGLEEGRFLVLLADDNADMRNYVGRLLSEHYDLITAINGEEAFEKILSRHPDLVLSDIMMPGLDGFGLLKKIRSHPEVRTTPVIFLSARAGEESRVEGLQAGADDYLVKPFSARELIARVDSNLRIDAARRLEEQERFTSELRKMNAMLQQSNEDLRQFAHVASHDLKEPVRKVKVYMGRLQEDSATTFSARSKGYLEKINSAANRMLKMIEGVLHYSTVNSTEQQTEAVDLNRIVRSIESDLELVIGQKKATLHYSQLPAIEGAAVLLYQLFYNLINNSLKFSRADVPCRIEISSIQDQDQALIRLTDNGIGFDQAQAERIFDTFSRLNAKDKYEGTGLGLSLCRKIVLRHGGEIEAAGKKGEGSEFRIRLPLKGGTGHFI